MNLDLEEKVTIKTKDGEFEGVVRQFETSKKMNSVLYRVTVHIFERPKKASVPMSEGARINREKV